MKGGLAMKRRNINLKEMAHTLGRVLRYMLKNYKGSFCVVVVHSGKRPVHLKRHAVPPIFD